VSVKAICLTFLFLSEVVCLRAQLPQSNGVGPQRYLSPTPAQSNWLDALNNSIDIPLWQSMADRPSGESVSIWQLRHKPAGKAMTFFRRGMKLALAGKWLAGANQFARAVAIDPDFAEAYANLGVSDCALGLYDRAANELRRAIELDPATGFHHLNYAYTLIRLNRDKEAQPEAETAVALNPGNSTAHYVLGFLLAQRPETRERGIQQLQFAAREIPEAQDVLSRVSGLEGKR
jgi:tetratricopeptide (TPR) repeat protein